MDGVLLIDKPSGPTSHDVVARIRRAAGERSVGHTGTLDPRATGLLLLVLGRATRLSALLSGAEKTYEATLRLGFATETDDADGQPLGEMTSARPTNQEIESTLAAFRGTFNQLPPTHSAKRVAGQKAYDLARRAQAIDLQPVPVTVTRLDLVGRDGDLVHIVVTASAGFYVRALARDVGGQLGCGAHLAGLRRSRVGGFDVADAIALAAAEQLGPAIEARVVPPADALPDLPAVRLTAPGLKRAVHGNAVGPEHLDTRFVPPATLDRPVRVLGPDGRLVALAQSRGGALHPVVVLG